ncbi:hypothetical protein BOW53_13090 [Solemya pervernicosa gill symbiont]|uniref:Prolyl 4-hydroxylase alpha subunit Fe(2+) 2OG dioxygenase domain-containing protein n=2 Tax=Gammaproteobacteria incertae sedis TaxID=118884 RepID=A0A1T2L1X7_9GAMM|nr:2OG-Fe(II) oxygenase [Candidatus Reidiella endopervernicosa]OOZ39064.1 hypothetical protein BOW53_13090 [Solemya pervernicosa gill symbiont]QKQ25169.1 2OG-Fe(II) oxygenase [Candidatus Reidiella endopervernicosa]
MNKACIDHQQLDELGTTQFNAVTPFPWHSFSGLLTPQKFTELMHDFPPLDHFERHQDIPRGGQRPHNRLYLSYERTIYHDRQSGVTGLIEHSALPTVWQQFIEELEQGEHYRSFIARLLGTSSFKIRYAWHVGENGSEVSPHCDMHSKLATHLFYFNSDKEWQREWGGETLLLSDKKIMENNPEFEDFGAVQAVEMLNNKSFLFKNCRDGWHGVRRLDCPEGAYRRLFTVVIETTKKKLHSLLKRVRRRLAGYFT